MKAVRDIPIDHIFRNEDQPRQDFPADHINALAASIRENGLLQPITVRWVDLKRYEVVAGECRLRACRQLGLATISAIVVKADETDRDILAIAEILSRRDINPAEQGLAYQRMLDRGWTVEDLAKRLGIAPFRVTERTDLLKLRPEYLQLLAKGHLQAAAAWYLRKMTPDRQDRMVRAIRDGKAKTIDRMRALADALLAEQSQGAMFDAAETGELSDDEQDQVSRLERKVEAIAAMVGQGFNKDGAVDVARKVAPHRARDMADKLDLITKAIGHLTKDLRRAAAQLELVA